MKLILIALTLCLASTSSFADDSCKETPLPSLSKKYFEDLAVRKVLKKKKLNSYYRYDVTLHSAEPYDGKKNIASVDFYYKKSKVPFRLNFFINCKYGDYFVEDDL